ncbi:MAG: hypothetical protein P8N43_01020, partial [Alphaproteobacteria bacterium]|nr:hypothetical protein [Alphaproteobacteria bacterium]
MPLSPMAPAFRLAGPPDRENLEGMIRAFYIHERHEIDDALITSSLDAALVKNHHIRIWLIEIDGEIAGYLAVAIGFTIEAGGHDGFLDELYLEEKFR